tara:strand:+ start:319 stop:729 length:411 start_codon:yes stop_codon:yes gene_type:complete
MTILQLADVQLLRTSLLKVINSHIDLMAINQTLESKFKQNQDDGKQRVKSKGDDDFDAIKIENPNNSDSDEFPKRILTIYGVYEHFRWLCLRQIVVAGSNILDYIEDEETTCSVKSQRWIIHSLASLPRIDMQFQR